MSKVYDVIINGCGPTGLATALLLARAGHMVAILDRHEAIYPLPRAIAYDHEVARILGVLGLTDAMAPLVATPGVYQWQNQNGELLFELNWGDAASVSGYATSYLFSQPDMEKVLNDAAQVEPLIEVMRGLEATGIAQDAEGVTLTGRQLSGEAVCLRGRWLVGADGANSLVRSVLGVSLEDLGFRADWLVVDVIPKDGARLPLDNNLMLQVCDPARPTTIVSGGPGRRRWEFMALEGETLEKLNCEERAWELLKPWKVTSENAILERHAVYTFRGAIAEKWRDGRVFIAGDAAHLTPPFAGQGLCAGFRDAAALAWRLDLALKGMASEGLLDSFESERKAHARAWVMNAIELGNVICVLDPAAAAARDAGMKAARAAGEAPPSSGILPRLGTGMNLTNHHGGALAAGGKVNLGGKHGHFDDAVGSGFVLVSRLGDPARSLSRQAAAIFDALGGVSADVGPVVDCTSVYARWFDELGADTALIRPDFYLFGAASGPNAADELVMALAPYITVSATAGA